MTTNPYAAPEADVVKVEQRDGGAVGLPRKVRASRGSRWFIEGLDLVVAAPAGWLLAFLVFVGLYLLITIPTLIAPLVNPVGSSVFGSIIIIPILMLNGGVMSACHEEPFEFANAMRTVRSRGGQLAILGVLYMILSLTIMVAVMMIAVIVSGAGLASLTQTSVMIGTIGSVFLVGIFLMMPLFMAVWFAPALVAVGGRSATTAMIESFKGCAKNLLPLLVYILIAVVVAIASLLLASILIGLFAGLVAAAISGRTPVWLAVMPAGLVSLVFTYIGIIVFWSSQYASFRDIYVMRDAA